MFSRNEKREEKGTRNEPIQPETSLARVRRVGAQNSEEEEKIPSRQKEEDKRTFPRGKQDQKQKKTVKRPLICVEEKRRRRQSSRGNLITASRAVRRVLAAVIRKSNIQRGKGKDQEGRWKQITNYLSTPGERAIIKVYGESEVVDEASVDSRSRRRSLKRKKYGVRPIGRNRELRIFTSPGVWEGDRKKKEIHNR